MTVCRTREGGRGHTTYDNRRTIARRRYTAGAIDTRLALCLITSPVLHISCALKSVLSPLMCSSLSVGRIGRFLPVYAVDATHDMLTKQSVCTVQCVCTHMGAEIRWPILRITSGSHGHLDVRLHARLLAFPVMQLLAYRVVEWPDDWPDMMT